MIIIGRSNITLLYSFTKNEKLTKVSKFEIFLQGICFLCHITLRYLDEGNWCWWVAKDGTIFGVHEEGEEFDFFWTGVPKRFVVNGSSLTNDYFDAVKEGKVRTATHECRRCLDCQQDRHLTTCKPTADSQDLVLLQEVILVLLEK